MASGTAVCDAVQVADSAELVTVACQRGVAHPPGYPLYTLVGHLFCQAPWSTPAARLSALSLIAGVLAALLLYALARRLRCPRWIAALSALTMSTASQLWRLASYPETRTLQLAACLALIYAGLRVVETRGLRRLCWCGLLGLAGGLALSSHHTAAALGPFAVAALLLPWSGVSATLQRAACALAGLAMGLLPYLHLWLADPSRLPRWGQTETAAGFWHHVLRADYGAASLSVRGESAVAANLWHYAASMPAELAWLWWPVALGGLVLLLVPPLARRALPAGGPLAGRAHAVTLGLGILLAGPALLALFNVAPEGPGAQIVSRFHVLPNALLCLCLALGLSALDHHLLRRLAASRQRVWRAASFAVLALGALAAYPRADVSRSYAVEDYAHNLLTSADRDALVLGTGDVGIFATTYAQRMLGTRTDVQYVDPWMLLYPWYVDQQRRAHPGFSYRHRPHRVDTVRLIRAEMARGRTVYLSTVHSPKVARAFRAVPEGPLLRLLPPGARPLTSAEVLARNRALEPRLRRRGRPPDPAIDPWSAGLWELHARPWRALARMARAAGQPRLAAEMRRRAARWSPWREAPR